MEAGGAQKVASLLTHGLRERGHEVHLWFLYKKRQAYDECAEVRALQPQRPRFQEYLTLASRLWSNLRSEMPDAVITHTHSANIFAAPIAALAQVPIRIAVHHNPFETYSPMMRAADRCAFAVGTYSNMVTVSGGVTRSFGQRTAAYQNRLHHIYNAVGDGVTEAGVDIRTRYGIPVGMKIMVNVGRLTEQKNQRLLLSLLQRVSNGFLLLVGEGELRANLLAEADALGVTDRLCLTGELPTKQVNTILAHADVFLLPSLHEAFCLAAVEAMQMGIPVVASDTACLREVLGDQQLFFPVNNLDTLTRRVRYLLAHPSLAKEMSTAGKARAERYSVKRMVGAYEFLLEDTARSAKKYVSAADNLRGIDTLGSIASVHDQV